MPSFNDVDRKILARIQGDLPLEARPFDGWAKELGIEPGELLERLAQLKQEGIIREMKAILRHRKAGFSSGAMVCWSVPEQYREAIGKKIAGRHDVSHCYERPGFGEYSLFSMIHGKTDRDVEETIADIASSLGISTYKVYWSVRELKKSSMEYFREDKK